MSRGLIYDDVTDSAGNAIPGIEVTIYLAGTVTKATLYDDPDAGVVVDNPLTTDDKGVFTAYAAPGNYDYSAAAPAGTIVRQDVPVLDPDDVNSIEASVAAAAASAAAAAASAGEAAGDVLASVQSKTSLADLKASEEPTDGKWFSWPQDGYGQLTGYWDADSVLTANDINVIALDGIATGRVIVPDVRQVPTLAALKALDTSVISDSTVIKVISYYSNGDVELAVDYKYNASGLKSGHNGGTIISDTVPWDGVAGATHTAFLAGTGETDGAGSGVWELQKTGLNCYDFGAVDTTDSGGANASIFNNLFSAAATMGVPACIVGDDEWEVSDTVYIPNNIKILGIPSSGLTSSTASVTVEDNSWESVSGHSDNIEFHGVRLFNNVTNGVALRAQPRGLLYKGGRITAPSGYGVKLSAAADQAFENHFDGVLFKGCKYPVWSKSKLVDPVDATAAYSFENSDGFITNCIFDGYSGASVVMEYSLLGGGSGWRLSGNHWYGTNAVKFLSIRGINIGIADYFERNGTDAALELITGNPASYNLAGSVFYLDDGGACVVHQQGSFHQVKINFSGAVVEGGDDTSEVARISFAAGTGRNRLRINMSGVEKDINVPYGANTYRFLGMTDPFIENNAESTKTWALSELYDDNILEYTGSGSAFISIPGTDSPSGRNIRITNASPSKTITLTGSTNIAVLGGATATSYALLAGKKIELSINGSTYRVLEVN